MNLHSAPIEMLQSGIKTIELWLYDEKRRLIPILSTMIALRASYDKLRVVMMLTKARSYEL